MILRYPKMVFESPPSTSKQYEYNRTCADCEGCVDDLSNMVEEAVTITYSTMLRNCDGLLDWAVSNGYSRKTNQGSGVTLRNDPYVAYYTSTFQESKCYYLVWSGYEVIWTKKKERGAKPCI